MSPHPSEADDDALADLLADRLVELAQQPGVLRLAALQMAGIVPTARLESQTIARHLGCTTRRIQQIQTAALAKLALNKTARQIAAGELRSL